MDLIIPGTLFLAMVVAILVGTPLLVVKIFRYSLLKQWFKCILGISSIIGGLYMLMAIVFYAMIYFLSYSFCSRDLATDPLDARTYVEEIGVRVKFPDFKVVKHRFEFTGGDDTEEYWIIEFKQPLQEVFLNQLDSLCLVDSKWWRNEQDYVFSYWDPDLVELRYSVDIHLQKRTARLSRIKI